MKRILVAFFALMLALPAFANPTVISPTSNQEVTSPFTLEATATACDSQVVHSIGYSIDDSKVTTIVHTTSIKALVVAGVGNHVLHVKTWGAKGAACSVAVAIDVLPQLAIPTNATVVSNIQQLSIWEEQHDTGTPGSSSGTTGLVTTPSLSGQSRQFTFSYQSAGGELFHAVIGKDTLATHFIYDAWVYFPSLTGVANVEMDMNQVMANGQTVIYGFQCDGYDGTWDFSSIHGWVHSNAPCAPKDWAPGVWHHVQISYERDSVGNITYQTVVFDGALTDLENATVAGARSLGWGVGTLLVNFQIDGQGASGAATAYVDNLTVYRW